MILVISVGVVRHHASLQRNAIGVDRDNRAHRDAGMNAHIE